MNDSAAELAIDILHQPRNWTEIAPSGRPIEVEIGSGKGLFLRTVAAEHPERFFVGIELAMKFANVAASKIAKSKLTNATMLRGDAQVFLKDVIPTGAIHRFHVYFPDPWWRNKHKKRRVLNEQAIADIVRGLIPGGEFHFWTDVLDYYELICSHVMDHTPLLGPRFVPQRTAAHTMDYTTHFERRARLNGGAIYRAIFVKPDNSLALQTDEGTHRS